MGNIHGSVYSLKVSVLYLGEKNKERNRQGGGKKSDADKDGESQTEGRREADGETEKNKDRWTDRRREEQTDRATDRWRERDDQLQLIQTQA